MNLMNLHILFAPPQEDADRAQLPPTARMPLTLDEEVQYRCAEFIQAEIERYAEDTEELSPPPSDASDNSDTEKESDGDRRPKHKGDKSKHSTQNGLSSKIYSLTLRSRGSSNLETANSSRSKLEREYLFMGVITTFLRAIRASVVHFQHSATLLAHYSRLGQSFDLCSKVIVDILREEGLYKNNGDAVVGVVSQALREVDIQPHHCLTCCR